MSFWHTGHGPPWAHIVRKALLLGKDRVVDSIRTAVEMGFNTKALIDCHQHALHDPSLAHV